jgi:hypothetical protein
MGFTGHWTYTRHDQSESDERVVAVENFAKARGTMAA